LKSGTRAGMYYTVVSNGTDSLVLDTAGDTLSAAITSDTTLEVIPYDTLGTIFPGGVGVHPSATHGIGTRQSEIYLPDLSTAGKNLALTTSYYYFSPANNLNTGWRKAGAAAVLENDAVLPPDSFFVVRHNIAADTTLTFTGTVQMAPLAAPIGTVVASVDQDNAVALPFATEMTLAQLKLYESGAFAHSPSHGLGVRQDELLVYVNGSGGKNKAPDAIYYYFDNGVPATKGWRRSGVAGTIADNDVVVGPTKSIVIRKKGTTNPSSVLWSVKPPYVP